MFVPSLVFLFYSFGTVESIFFLLNLHIWKMRDQGLSKTTTVAQRSEQEAVSPSQLDLIAPDLPLTSALAIGAMNSSPHRERPIRGVNNSRNPLAEDYHVAILQTRVTNQLSSDTGFEPIPSL